MFRPRMIVSHSEKKEFQRSAIAVHPAHLKDNLEPVFLSCMDPSHERNFDRGKRHSGLQGKNNATLAGTYVTCTSSSLQLLLSNLAKTWQVAAYVKQTKQN
jgi:hypothetical protein